MDFKSKLKHLAALNAVVEPEWEYRYYSYNSQWGDAEEMASLRDGCGGEWFTLFFGDKCAFKCTSPVDGVLDNFDEVISKLPPGYDTFINEPAFSMNTGSCIWYLDDGEWVKLGNDALDLPNPETIQKMTPGDFCDFVEEIYEQEIDEQLVEAVFKGNFSIEIAKSINPDIDIDLLKNDLLEIGINA